MSTHDDTPATPQGALPGWITILDGRTRRSKQLQLATYHDLQRARATTAQDLVRAKRHGQALVLGQYQTLLSQLDVLLALLAPVMQHVPAMAFAEACTLLEPGPLKRIRAL